MTVPKDIRFAPPKVFTGISNVLWDLPSHMLDQLRTKLQSVEDAAQAGLAQDELLNAVRKVTYGSAISVVCFDAPTRISRAVPWLVKPDHVKLIGRKPAHLVTEAGRVNTIGQSVFYGALTGPAACLYECRAEVGQTFAVGTWYTTERMCLAHVAYSHPRVFASRLGRHGYGGWLDEQSGRQVDRVMTEWYTKLFTARQSPNLYPVTIAIAQAMLTRHNDPSGGRPQLAGVLYPSVAGELFGDNVALDAEPAERLLKFQRCEFVRVTKLETARSGEPFVTYQQLDVCTELGPKSELVWRGAPEGVFKPTFSTMEGIRSTKQNRRSDS